MIRELGRLRGSAAVAKCDAGDYKAGIPVLVKALTDAKVPLPPRT